MPTDLGQLLHRITRAVSTASDDAGVRITATYEPVGGPGSKVFPPTYPFGDAKYALEHRYDDSGELREVVLIDSFQAQANRCELALLDAVDDGLLAVPYLQLVGEVPMLDASPPIPIRITSLEAPHRGPDAYFRDSEDDAGTEFDKTDVGAALRRADVRDARAFFRHVPTDLIYGFWDSQRGGRGVKLARAYTSEVFAWDPKIGRRGAGRIDPMNIEKARIAYPDKKPGEFVVLGDGPVPKGMKEKKPSEAGHGNIPPNEANPGVAVRGVERSAFVSAAALARLRFPDNGTEHPGASAAARAALFALALAGDRLAFDRPATLLRSGCELVLTSSTLAWVGRGGARDAFDLSAPQSLELVGLAVDQAAQAGITWASEPVALRPKQNLLDLLAQTFAAPPEKD